MRDLRKTFESPRVDPRAAAELQHLKGSKAQRAADEDAVDRVTVLTGRLDAVPRAAT